ncbi:MAG: hemerythrin domain-containing protein [Vicinamibacteria bacterium]
MTTTAAPRTIDLRWDTDGDHSATVLEAFDTLVPGESVVILARDEPCDVLRRLQVDRKGTFEWSLLETGPPRFRAAITRRDAPLGAQRGITEALAWDHDRLDALEGEAFALLARGDALGAEAVWSEFTVGLRRHIRFEEEILFPVFEEKLGVPASHGPTAVMRLEHRKIEELIGAIGRAVRTGDGDAASLRSELHRVLGEHNVKEEGVLYPGTDRSLDAQEADALVARIQAS